MLTSRSYQQHHYKRKQSGFTLIELIVTIMIMGILAYGSVQFILNTSGAYASSQERSRLGILATSTIERLSKEIKQAEAGSFRVSNNDQFQCIEFLSVRHSSTNNAPETVELLQTAPSPVSICWVDQQLYHYTNYTGTTEQPAPAQLPRNAKTGRTLLADNVSTPSAMFQLVENGFGQPLWLLFTIDFRGKNDHLLIQQEVGLSQPIQLTSDKAPAL